MMQIGDRFVNLHSGHSGSVVAIFIYDGDRVDKVAVSDHDLITAVVIEDDSGGYVSIPVDPGDLVPLDTVMH